VASVKKKFKVPATQHHHRKRPAPAHWRAISNVQYLFGLALYLRTIMPSRIWKIRKFESFGCMWVRNFLIYSKYVGRYGLDGFGPRQGPAMW